MGKRLTRVYIASPYSKGDVGDNVSKHMDVASRLIDMGFIPFVPLLYHFMHIHHPKDYAVWFDQDLYWLEKCDCLLRLPGESEGADKEVAYAKQLGIPVFYSVDKLLSAGVVKSDWDLRECFKQLRFDKNHHLGLGDIRLTIAQQEEICELVDRFYRCA